MTSPSHNPKVDIVIPTHNRASVLPRAIRSVLGQTHQNFELFIVDDGSTDRTREAVMPFLRDSRVHYLIGEKHGVSSARNAGVSQGQAPWIAFLDSDDEWLSHKLEAQFRQLKKNSAPLVHGEEIWIRRGKRVNAKKKHQKSGGNIYSRCTELCLISPSAAMMRRETYRELGGFDENYEVCEDYDLWLKLTSRYPVSFVTDPIIRKYGGHSDQLSSKYKAMDAWRVQSLLRMIEAPRWAGGLGLEEKLHTCREILKKGEILEQGYKKHGRQREAQQLNSTLIRVEEYLREWEYLAENTPQEEGL